MAHGNLAAASLTAPHRRLKCITRTSRPRCRWQSCGTWTSLRTSACLVGSALRACLSSAQKTAYTLKGGHTRLPTAQLIMPLRNAFLPDAELSTNLVEFGKVKYLVPTIATVTLVNVGQVRKRKKTAVGCGCPLYGLTSASSGNVAAHRFCSSTSSSRSRTRPSLPSPGCRSRPRWACSSQVRVLAGTDRSRREAHTSRHAHE